MTLQDDKLFSSELLFLLINKSHNAYQLVNIACYDEHKPEELAEDDEQDINGDDREYQHIYSCRNLAYRG